MHLLEPALLKNETVRVRVRSDLHHQSLEIWEFRPVETWAHCLVHDSRQSVWVVKGKAGFGFASNGAYGNACCLMQMLGLREGRLFGMSGHHSSDPTARTRRTEDR